MKILYSSLILLLLTSLFQTAYSQTHSHWINELHYIENDLQQGFEIAGPAYVDLSQWTYIIYNDDGSIRSSNSLALHGTIEREPPGSLGCIWVDVDLNSSGGGIALLDGTTLLDFISYEIPLTVDIESVSRTAYQIPVIEDIASLQSSLQLTGVGTTIDSFDWWHSIFPSYGVTNVNQAFMADCVDAPLNEVWHETWPIPDPTFNCTYYASRMGMCNFDFAQKPGVAGLTGQQACCICGGGVTWGPTAAPSFAPSNNPSKNPSTSPSVEPTKTIASYEQELADCQNQTAVYQEILDDYTSTIEMCEARGISLSCTSPPTSAPLTQAPSLSPSNPPITLGPSGAPSESPSSSFPSTRPSLSPQTDAPSASPTASPSAGPTPTDPSRAPSSEPSTSEPSTTPSLSPTNETPTTSPSAAPTNSPSVSEPSASPIVDPSSAPSFSGPSTQPSEVVLDPTNEPTSEPSTEPSIGPSEAPQSDPSASPSCVCKDLSPPSAPGGIWSEDGNDDIGVGRFTCFFITTFELSLCDGFSNYGITANQACCGCGGGSCNAPSSAPVYIPTSDPTISQPSTSPIYSLPSTSPSLSPSSIFPSVSPSKLPTSDMPTLFPITAYPSKSPTFDFPTVSPSLSPSSDMPSLSPDTSMPTTSPTFDAPTTGPSNSPEVSDPTVSPSNEEPSLSPISSSPTMTPSLFPSHSPTLSPSSSLPSQSPETSDPTVSPSEYPTETKVDCYDYTPVNGTAFYGGQWVDKWYDSQRLLFDCDWYARTNRSMESCTYFAPMYYGLDGLNAKQACCVCGGGITDEPSAAPSPGPSLSLPTQSPSLSDPSVAPSSTPLTSYPSKTPSSVPSSTPSISPTPSDPTKAPSSGPTSIPTPSSPSSTPSQSPTSDAPTSLPIFSPSESPIVSPSNAPSFTPTLKPSEVPTINPTTMPTSGPTCQCQDLRPPAAPGGEWHERGAPGRFTCAFYSTQPDLCIDIGSDPQYAMFGHTASTACCVCGGGYCGVPTVSPTYAPSSLPSQIPTFTLPSVQPTIKPFTSDPSTAPSVSPTTDSPSIAPSDLPTASNPSVHPTLTPSIPPVSSIPTVDPSTSPSVSLPSVSPTLFPTDSLPTTAPSEQPSASLPSASPSDSPDVSEPSCSPFYSPSTGPTERVHCVDFVPEGETEWYDGYVQAAIKLTCEDYESNSVLPARNFCDIFNIPERDANFGMIANQACCFCGGGITDSPTKAPTSSTSAPSETPARVPTISPSEIPSSPPVTDAPTMSPSTTNPSQSPTIQPTDEPTAEPTSNPSMEPTTDPTINPTTSTLSPTIDPTKVPSTDPTLNPTGEPTVKPSDEPTSNPSIEPSDVPTVNPTDSPIDVPSKAPATSEPTPCECVDLIPPGEDRWYDAPDKRFDCDFYASNPESYCDNALRFTYFGLNAYQACCACTDPLTGISGGSCYTPSEMPTVNPSLSPSRTPTEFPTTSVPSTFPSVRPSPSPTRNPSNEPTLMPTMTPTVDPTLNPTSNPSLPPSMSTPTVAPTKSPVTTQPSLAPSMQPTISSPSSSPSGNPSYSPTERTCAEKVEDTIDEIESCQDALTEAQNNLTVCESVTVDQATYDELLANISDCNDAVADLQDELFILQNGALSACTGNVYVEVYRSDYAFLTGVYFADDDGSGMSYTAINNDAEQVLKHLQNGTWILTNGDVRLVTPVVLTGIYPPSLDQWVDPDGLLVIVKMACYEPQVVDDCDCGVYDNDDDLLYYSGVDCATSAVQFNGTACDQPQYGSYISHFCPATCGRTWAETLIDDDSDVALYGSALGWPFTTCRDPTAYCVDEYVQHPVYRTLCPIATAECENVVDVCDLVCTRRQRRRLQDLSSTCPFAAVTAYHSSYSHFDGTFTLTDAENSVYESDSATLSYFDGTWSLDDTLTTETNDPNPPAAANWRSGSGSIVVITVECALTNDAMTYEECTTQLDETQEALEACTTANTQLEADISTCWSNCAANQQAGADCEAAKAAAEVRDAFVDVPTVDSGTDIGWEQAQYINRGMDPDVASRLRHFNNEIVYDNLDGTYTRTCVAYSTSATSSCEHDDLICPGGRTYGWPGQTYPVISAALERPDKVHPDCPTGCTLSSWWADYLTSNGLNSNEICIIGDSFYFIEERQYVFTCIATSDNYSELCPNNNIVCAGTNSEGYKIYGWPSYQTQLLTTAVGETNHRYPYCPNY